MAIRVSRLFGNQLALTNGANAYFAAETSGGIVIEASPIYTALRVSIRMWGSYFDGTDTYSIDETIYHDYTRIPIIGTSDVSYRPTLFVLAPETNSKILTPDSLTRDVKDCRYANLISPLGDSTALADDEIKMILFGREVYCAGGAMLPNAKRQAVFFQCNEQFFDFTYSSTGTPSTGTIPIRASVPSLPEEAHIPTKYWGDIDVSAWSDAQWRDIRGDWVVETWVDDTFGFDVEKTITIS